MLDLSIIIPSFNTKDCTEKTIISLFSSLDRSPYVNFEVFVVDNNSKDGSVEMLSSIKGLKSIFLSENKGYSFANNVAVAKSMGRYILFLNSDMLLGNVDFAKLISYMDKNDKIGALTVRVELESGSIDKASHRGFPTIWRSFCYYSGLSAISDNLPSFFKRVFGGYHLKHLDISSVHEIDSPTGAFMLCRSDIIKMLGGFDEDYFMYGEDLDLAFRIKKLGYKIFYYPKYTVTHLKYKSGLKNNNNETKNFIREHFYKSMGIFYKKHYEKDNFFLVNWLVYFLIGLKSYFSK